jgi:peptidoglycan hydrolase-like protein with peptidoglycan-binding domain
MAGEQLISGLTYLLGRDDSDALEKRKDDEKEGKVYGGRFHEGPFKDEHGDPINWVARLKVTLAKRGFRLDPTWDTLDHKKLRTKEKDGVFTAATEWAVREFQIAAGYPKALSENGQQIEMKDIPGARYSGPISGVLNAETLRALKFWDSQNPPLICQIEISGFGEVPLATDETTGVAPDPVVKQQNLWRDNEITEASRVFAKDQSGQFYRPGPTSPLPRHPRSSLKYQVTGSISPYNGKYGPLTDARHSWKRASDESEVLPERLFEVKTGAALQRQISTFRIIRAAADVECYGFFEGGNAYDDQIVSFGLAHWTIRPAIQSDPQGGELPAFLAYFRQRYPAQFEQTISRFGYFTSSVWQRHGGSADGLALLVSGKRTYDCQSSLMAETTEAEVMQGAFEEMRYLRNWHWLYRFIMAGRGVDAYRRAMWDMARIRLRIILDANWPEGTQSEKWPIANKLGGTRPAKLGETFRSEQTLAMLLRWHVYRPGHVRSGDTVGQQIQKIYQSVRDLPPFANSHNVEDWTSYHEYALANAIVERWNEAFNKSKPKVDWDRTVELAGQWLSADNEAQRNYQVAAHLPSSEQAFTILASEAAATQLPGKMPTNQGTQWVQLLSPIAATIVLFQRFADENIALTANGARIGRLSAQTWYLEDREEPADATENGALLRRFHLERLPSQDIRVRELPVVSQKRHKPNAGEMFEMDCAGLPRLKYRRDPDGQKMIQYEIASGNGTLSALGMTLKDAMTNGQSILTGPALAEFVKPLADLLPLTDVGLDVPTMVDAVESGGPGRDRWLVRTTNPNLQFFTLRRVDVTHVNVDWPGESLRYDAIELKLGMSSANVKALREDLATLGIDAQLLSDTVQVNFDEQVKAAVRAFQSYARREFVAKEASANNSLRWVQRLTRQAVEHPLRYHGIVNGIVNLETRSLMDHWIAEKWRCPVVIDARKSPAGADNSIIVNKDNLWRFADHTDPDHFFFVTDFSIPPSAVDPTAPPQTQPLAVYRNGPSVENVFPSAFFPATREISIESMAGRPLAEHETTEEMKSTVKVLQAVAGQLPCQGFLDGVNTADAQRVINIGAMNLQEKRVDGDTNTELRGRLGTLLSLSQAVEQRAFGQGFGRDRIRSSADWKRNASDILNNDPHARLVTRVSRQHDPTNASTYGEIVSETHAAEWRGWHSVYRAVCVARLEGTGRAYYDIARLELHGLGSLLIEHPHRLQHVVTSERAWAMLGLWHAKHPADLSKFADPVIQKKHTPAQPLRDVIAAVKAKGHVLPFSTLQAQQDVIATLVKVVTDRYSAPVVNPDLKFVTAINTLSTNGSLNNAVSSWRLDHDHLPHFTFKTGLITALLNPSKEPAHTTALALAGSSGKTTTSLGFYGTADIENNKFHATHSAFTIADSNGNLQTLICPLLTEREMDLELNEPEDFTTTVYRSPGQKEESLAVVRCKATDANKEQLKGDGDKWSFNPEAVLGTPAIPITAGLKFADLDFDADGFLTGKITADFSFQPPFGDPLPVSLGGVGNSSTDVAFTEFTLDEDNGQISAPTSGLFKSLASFLNLPEGSEFDFKGAMDGDRFELSFATPDLKNLALDLVPTLVSFNMENVRLTLDTLNGFGIDLAEGIDRAMVGLSSDLFANAGTDAVINHACESITNEDFGKLFKLGPDDANGILMEAGARLVSWDGRSPRLSSTLLAGLTKLEVNAARRLRSFAGELLGGLAERCHSKFGEAVGKSIRFGRDSEQGVWFVEVPLQMTFNDEANHGGESDDADKRDFLKLTGWFRFTCSGDDDFVRFGAGSFCVDPEVVLEVDDPGSYKGRSFGSLVSLHIPDKSVFVFNTDPTQASIRWDVERSRAKQAETSNADDPVNAFQKILIRVPASTGDVEPEKMSEPEAKRFTFEMNDFGLGVAGLDLAGQIRVESVTMNDDDTNADQQTETGLQAPLSVEKADSRPKDASDGTPVVGEILFRKSRLVFGSLKAGFQLRYFDNATGTIAFAMAEDLETKQLSVTGTVEINSPVEYKLDALYALFQLRSVRLSMTYTRTKGKVRWTSDGAIAGAIKFQPPAGKSADGPLSAVSDFFAGVTCEFEDLNPVKLGRGATVTFNFPAKTFNLANVMEVDLNGITVGDSGAKGSNRFGLLGDVRLKDLPGVGGTLTFGGIDLTATDDFVPKIDIKRIGAALTLPGGIGIEAEFERIKNEQESGFAGRMTLTSESLPKISGLLKLTDVRCLSERRSVPSLALYLGAAIDAPLVFGFYLRGLGMGLGIFQGLRGLRKADAGDKSITQRVISFVDDPRGLPDPGTLEAWQPDAPETVRSRLNWMLVAQALITYGKFPPDKPHVITGTLLGALDQDLTLTLGTNIWLFASPEEVTKPDFKPRPVARGAMQLSPREGKVFAYFRTLPNPKMGPTAPELVTKVLDVVQTSCMFLADGNGFLTEVGWPWETRVDAAKIGLPSPLKGELSAGFRFGVYRGVVTFGLNFGIEVQMKADVGFDFDTPLGSAGAHLSVNGSGMFRASFVGAIDQAQRPYLLGDVRVAAQVSVQVEAHCELSKKITRWCRIRLRIRFRESFNLSVTAALAAAMNSDGLGFSGDAHVSVCVSRYRISGRVPFQFNPDRVGAVRKRLDEILPKPITAEGNNGIALNNAQVANFVNPAISAVPASGTAVAEPTIAAVVPTHTVSSAEFSLVDAGVQEDTLELAVVTTPAEAAEVSPLWHYRSREVLVAGTAKRRVLIALVPAPGTRYPELRSPVDPPSDRFSIALKKSELFKGFLLGEDRGTITDGVLNWMEDCAAELISADEMRREYERLDEDPLEAPAPEPLKVGTFLFGVGNSTLEEPTFEQISELVDSRTLNPTADDTDDETVGVAPKDHRSPNFGRDTDYDRRIATSCSRQGEVQDGKSPKGLSDADDPDAERIDGPSAAMLAIEVLDLFQNDAVAVRSEPFKRENVPADMFLAQYLRSVLVFDLPEGDTEKYSVEDLIDVASFKIRLGKAPEGQNDEPANHSDPISINLEPPIEKNPEDYDLIVGHHFQARELVGLCWDLRLEDQPNDAFAAYQFGFEQFRVTRTNLTRPTVKPRIEFVTPCWLDPTKGERRNLSVNQAELIRPQFQYVDRDLGNPEDPDGDFREGDELQYRVEAIGPSVFNQQTRQSEPIQLTQCLFGITRRTVRPQSPPVIAQALHMPEMGILSNKLVDAGWIELSLVSSTKNDSGDSDVEIKPEEVRVRYRLVPASSMGSYGFDSPVSVTTRPEPGLSQADSNELGIQTIRFSASPRSRPMPWEETSPLNLITLDDWELFELPLPTEPNTIPDKSKFQPVLRLKKPLSLKSVRAHIALEHGEDALRGQAIEFWIGREKAGSTRTIGESSNDGTGADSQPIQRSILVQCRHAVLLPMAKSVVSDLIDKQEIKKDYFTIGTPIAGIEWLASRPAKPSRANRYLEPTLIHCELRGSTVPLGYDPNTPQMIPDDGLGAQIPNPNYKDIQNDVRIRLTWRMPPEPIGDDFDPVIAFRQYRVDRFNPVLHRVHKELDNGVETKLLEPLLERVVQVVPDQLYRSTPDLIDILPISEGTVGLTPTYRGDWQARPGQSQNLWRPDPLHHRTNEHPFVDDPDRSGSTFLHESLLDLAAALAVQVARVVGKSDDSVRVVWRVREPFEDRADLLANTDRAQNIDDPKHIGPFPATQEKEARFKAAFDHFAASHQAKDDPYGWKTLESLGLSAELQFVIRQTNEPINLDQLYHREQFIERLKTSWEQSNASPKPPIEIVFFQADDGFTLLNVVRLIYVGELPDWTDALGFDLRLAAGLKFLGVDPKLRSLQDEEAKLPVLDAWKRDFQFASVGPTVALWLKKLMEERARSVFGADSSFGGRIHFFHQTLFEPRKGFETAITRAVPIQEDGTVRVDLPVLDRLAHHYDIALEPCRRYDALWEQLLIDRDQDGNPSDADPMNLIPMNRTYPVKIDRTRPLVPHNVIATPLQGAVQSYVFAHPAEFAACASAINAAAVEYSGHTVYLQRRIPTKQHERIETILNDRGALLVDWNRYQRWLDFRKYEEIEFVQQEIEGDESNMCESPDRQILLIPSTNSPAWPPTSWNAMRTLPVTQVGIYGADRYVIPDVPAYYEYRFAAFSTAGNAQSPLAVTPFVKPLFDEVIQPPTSDGFMFAESFVIDDEGSLLNGETILMLEIVLSHPRLHLRPEMRGLWVQSDETFQLPLEHIDGFIDHRYGSLPDLELEYVLLFNGNYDKDEPNGFQVLNPLITLIPPLDPQRQPDEQGRYSPLFLAKSPDESCAKILDAGRMPQREATVSYIQDSVDGSIRAKIELVVGRKSGEDVNDSPKARMFRELLKQAKTRELPDEIEPALFTFIVRRSGVQSKLIKAKSSKPLEDLT